MNYFTPMMPYPYQSYHPFNQQYYSIPADQFPVYSMFQLNPYCLKDNFEGFTNSPIDPSHKTKQTRKGSPQIQHSIDFHQKCIKTEQKQKHLIPLHNITPKKKANDLFHRKFKDLNQKEGRNASSNILRMFYRSIHIKLKSNRTFLKNIIQFNTYSITLEQFEEWFRDCGIDHRNYIRVQTVRRMFNLTDGRQGQFGRLIRVLFKNFIENECRSHLLSSKRVKKETVQVSLMTLRTMINCILRGE